MSWIQETTNDLDCSGEDSGLDACWSDAVNIGVPIACVALFCILLGILYAIRPKIPKEDQEMVTEYHNLIKEVEALKSNKPMEMMTATSSSANLVPA